jgi:SAM-dependent methyltransferase
LSDPLEFTGERFTPECVREIRYEHFHRYAFAREYIRGKTVLDAACGEGYGSAILAGAAAAVTGVDLSAEIIQHAKTHYSTDNLEFRAADCTSLPFDDASFDCIVSFETLEHLEKQDELLAEFRRLLRPDGLLLISTPDRAVYTDALGNRNEFHVRELYRREFETLLGRYFPACRLFGQKLLFQSAIWSLEEASGRVHLQERDGDISASGKPHHEAVYLLAFCAASEAALPALGPGLSLFDDAAESVYEHYYHEIRKNMAAGGILEERDREISELKSALEKRRGGWLSRLLGRG